MKACISDSVTVMLGFSFIDDVFADGELQEIADRYKRLTGMKRDPSQTCL